jgi:hypothetical protein
MSVTKSIFFGITTENFRRGILQCWRSGFVSPVPSHGSLDDIPDSSWDDVEEYLENGINEVWLASQHEEWEPIGRDVVKNNFIINELTFTITILKYLQKNLDVDVLSGELRFRIEYGSEYKGDNINASHFYRDLNTILSVFSLEYGWMVYDWSNIPSDNFYIDDDSFFDLEHHSKSSGICFLRKTLTELHDIRRYVESGSFIELNNEFLITAP